MTKAFKKSDKKMNQLGSMFLGVSGNGNEFFKGKLNINGVETAIVAWPNDVKSKDGEDLTVINIYESTPLEGSKKSTTMSKPKKTFTKKTTSTNAEDIPF